MPIADYLMASNAIRRSSYGNQWQSMLFRLFNVIQRQSTAYNANRRLFSAIQRQSMGINADPDYLMMIQIIQRQSDYLMLFSVIQRHSDYLMLFNGVFG